MKLSAAITAAAVVVEVKETGEEIPRNDLTSKIVPFSYDNSLTVAEGGMVRGTYKSAKVTIPEGSSAENGTVSFRYTGEGGTFTKNVVFKLEGPEIVFAQDNLGLPAYYDKASELWFGIIGITDADVTAEYVESGCPYRVALEKDKKVPDLWCAWITDSEKKPPEGETTENAPQPGDTKRFILRVTATAKLQPGKTPAKVSAEFEVLRVQMRLSLRFEADALGCYLKVRDGAPLNVTNDDLEPCTTKGRLVLLRWNEDKHEIERIAAVTDPRVNVGIRAYKVENDDKAMIGEPLEKHQAMDEKLGVRLLSTKKLDHDGSRIVLLTCTSGGLDAPNRLRAEITVTVGYKDEVYEVKKKILLHSLPFRDKGDANAYSAMLKRDDEICENLTNIKIQIYSKYMKNLFSLYYFIGRMIDGYAPISATTRGRWKRSTSYG